MGCRVWLARSVTHSALGFEGSLSTYASGRMFLYAKAGIRPGISKEVAMLWG